MSDAEWELFKNIFPEKARKVRGIPAAYSHNILNLLLFILVTGCRWCEAVNGH